jgi:hypothetical protein
VASVKKKKRQVENTKAKFKLQTAGWLSQNLDHSKRTISMKLLIIGALVMVCHHCFWKLIGKQQSCPGRTRRKWVSRYVVKTRFILSSYRRQVGEDKQF